MNNSILIRRDAFHINHRLFRKERVGCQACHQVDRKANDGPVSGVLNLSHVFQFVVDGLNERSLPEENAVSNGHDLSLHVTLQLCNQLNTINKKPGKEFFANVSLVSDKSTEDLLNEGLVPERLPVIHIARRDHEAQEVSLFVANEVQFETIEPSHRALVPLGKSLENPVEMDALVLADAQSRTVDKADPRAAAQAALLDEQDERYSNLSLQFNEAIIGDGVRKQVGHILVNFIQVKVFQTFIAHQMKQYHDGYHLGIGQRAVTVVLPFRLVPLWSKSVNLDKSVINVAEVIRHTENFRNFVSGDRHSESVCNSLFALTNLQKLSLFS